MIFKRLIYASLILLAHESFFYGQQKSGNTYLFSKQENLEYAALKSFFFLVQQDYVVISSSNDTITRFGNAYFGKISSIGIIDSEQRLYIPGFMAKPWSEDADFEPYKGKYNPIFTVTHIKSLSDTVFRSFTNYKLDTNQSVMSLKIGIRGIKMSSTSLSAGTLIIFQSLNHAPEKKGDIQYSIFNISETDWNDQGIMGITTPFADEKVILGGAFFYRTILPAKIEWELAGIYTKVNNQWVIKSLTQ
jgi:hypothetical protein